VSAPLLTVTGDGTFRVAPDPRGLEGTGDAALDALVRLRSLLGDDLEEQIAARLYLPAALGTESADHVLPASLSLLAGTTGDLTSYGWRLGAGTSHAWQRARELADRLLDAARIALLEYSGPLVTTALGPLTLAAATFLPSGERTLADTGALRDLPSLLAEGLAERIALVTDRVPGATPAVLVREDGVGAVHRGTVPTASGYRRHRALAAPEIGARWQTLREELTAASGLDASGLTLALPADADLIAAARTAGWRSLAVSPAAASGLETSTGRRVWETIADARESGVELTLVVDPARLERELEAFAGAWTQLGYALANARGTTLLAHPRAERPQDPAAEPGRAALLGEQGLERLLRAAPAWAERLEA